MKRKWMVAVLVLVAISLLTGYDYYRSKQFTIEVVRIDPQPAPADGQSPVKVLARLQDSQGRPVEGHYLFAFSRGGGLFAASRLMTNGAGEVEFTYYPYKISKLQQLRDVEIEIVDESNSVFIEINTRQNATIRLIEPQDGQGESEHNLNDIFGE